MPVPSLSTVSDSPVHWFIDYHDKAVYVIDDVTLTEYNAAHQHVEVYPFRSPGQRKETVARFQRYPWYRDTFKPGRKPQWLRHLLDEIGLAQPESEEPLTVDCYWCGQPVILDEVMEERYCSYRCLCEDEGRMSR